MARTVAALPAGSRITDYISLGVVASYFPAEKVNAVLEQTNRRSVRQRDLPAHVVVYYVIALALYMRSSYREVLRCLLEGVQWLMDPSAKVKVAGKSGISQARRRLGSAPMKALYDVVVKPVATAETQGAWYRQWRLVSLDGSTFDVADTADNENRISAAPAPVAAPALTRRYALWDYWRMVLMCCSPPAWPTTPPTNSNWPKKLSPLWARACCVWRTASSPATSCGARLAKPERNCCGGPGRTLASRWNAGFGTAPI